MSGTTPNDELEQCISSWEAKAQVYEPIDELWADALEIECRSHAEQLREVIEETEDIQKTAGSYNE